MPLSKADYIRNGTFGAARVQFSLLLQEGASIQDVAAMAQQMQGSIHRALHCAIEEAGIAITGQPPIMPEWGTGPNPGNEPNPPKGHPPQGNPPEEDLDNFNPFA